MGKPSFESFYSVNLILLKFAGLLQFDSSPRFVHLTFVFLSVSMPVFLVGPAIYGVTSHWNDIDTNELADIITIEGQVFWSFFKAAVLIPKRERISNLIQRCKHLWNSVEDEKEYRSMKPFLRQGKCITIVILVLSILMDIGVATSPIFRRVIRDDNGTIIQYNRLPFPTGLDHRNRMIFNIWWAFQVPQIILTCFNIIAVDQGISALTLCIAAQMRIVAMRLEELQKHEPGNRCGNVEVRKKFYECVSRHCEVLVYCEELEEIFNPIFFIATLLGMSNLVMDGISIIMEFNQIIKYGPHLFGVFAQLLTYCWGPQRLINECAVVSRTVYSLPWTSWSPKDRKSVSIMLMRAQKPALVTAGKFAVMSVLLLSEIVTKSISFFTVIRTMI